MGITTEEFVTSFHSINGVTLGERRRNFFHLINSIEKTESGKIDFSRLHPKTPLEEKFKVEALIYFRRIPDLLDIFKSENPILIKRVLRESSWFVEEAFQTVSGEQLVKSVFPFISFNAKAKLLNKLALHLKNPQQADDLFEAVEKNYSLFLASKLLPRCSSKFIIDCIKSKRTTLTSTQFLTIIKNYPQEIESLVETVGYCTYRHLGYGRVFLYIAQIDTNLFLKLREKYKWNYRLGWRITDKFIRENKQAVIDNPKKYLNFLHNKQIPKTLNRDFEIFYTNLFPKLVDNLDFRFVSSILDNFPRNKQDMNLLINTFKKVYRRDVWDFPDLVNDKLMKMLPPEEQKQRAKPVEKPYYMSEDEWICYSKTEVSIPHLKKAISLASDIDARESLVRLLVKTCSLNEDTAALAEMCRYMTIKHRNDKSTVRAGFLEKLLSKFKFTDLEESHWTPIIELLQLFVMNEESFYKDKAFREHYIHFRLREDLPVKEQLIEWIKSYDELNIVKEEPQYEKRCLLLFSEIIPEIFKQDGKEGRKDNSHNYKRRHTDNKKSDSLNFYFNRFIEALIDWNRRYPEDQIPLFAYPNAVDCVKGALLKEENANTVRNVLLCYLQEKNRTEERTDWFNLYLTRSDHYKDVKIVYLILKQEPSVAFYHIEDIVRCVTLKTSSYRPESFFWSYLRNYRHMENFQKAIDILLLTLKEKEADNYDEKVKGVIKGLSYLLNENEFKNFIIAYYPTDSRADALNPKGFDTYDIQKRVGICLKNRLPASSALEHILPFCVGDYFKFVYGSLYSVCGNVNEDRLAPFCKKLAGRAVSVRKHSMHLTFRLLNKENIFGLINDLMQTEKNSSVRKFIFRAMFNFFAMNPEDRFWELVKSTANSVDEKDEEALQILLDVDKVPKKFVTRYIIFTWDYLNNLPLSKNRLDHYKHTLLGLLSCDVIKSFPKDLRSSVVKDIFSWVCSNMI